MERPHSYCIYIGLQILSSGTILLSYTFRTHLFYVCVCVCLHISEYMNLYDCSHICRCSCVSVHLYMSSLDWMLGDFFFVYSPYYSMKQRLSHDFRACQYDCLTTWLAPGTMDVPSKDQGCGPACPAFTHFQWTQILFLCFYGKHLTK